MSLEDLIKSLEAKLPGFSYTVFSQAPGMPVMLRWDHRSAALQKREAVLVRSTVAKDIKSGFESVLARYERFEREDNLKKAVDETQRRIKLRRAIEAEMLAPVHKRRPVEDLARKLEEPEVDDVVPEPSDEPVLTRRSLVLPE